MILDEFTGRNCKRTEYIDARGRHWIVYQIIDGRIKNGRPTILVTNLDRSELENLLTERVISRVIQSSYRLFFTGRCRRESVRRSAEEVF